MIATHSIELRPNFLGESRDFLLEYVRSGEVVWDETGPGDVWNQRVHPHHKASPEVRDCLKMIREQVIAEVSRTYGLTRTLYADGLALVRWRVGDWQGIHADRENLDGSPHPYPWRDYGSIIYLNDDFDGGQIHFPMQKLEPPIRPGLLAFFPGNVEHAHGVTKVTRGTRYTIASFLTHDERQKDWD